MYAGQGHAPGAPLIIGDLPQLALHALHQQLTPSDTRRYPTSSNIQQYPETMLSHHTGGLTDLHMRRHKGTIGQA